MPASSVPIITQHRPDDMVLAIKTLRDRAEADGNGSLAYVLDIACLQARQISDRKRRDTDEREAVA